MWGTVVVLALLAAPEPWRIGTATLLISRPRPLQNLLAFCLGGIALCTLIGVAVLFALRDIALTFSQHATAFAATSTFAHVQIGLGVVALLIAALLARSFSARRQALVPVPAGDAVMVLPPNGSTVISRLTARTQGMLAGGSPWVAFVAGAGMSTTPLEYPVALATILASGAAAGTQVNAVVLYAVVTFIIVELPLLSYLVTPTRTQAAMLRLHGWLQTRRRQVLTVMLGAIGIVLVATGVASV